MWYYEPMMTDITTPIDLPEPHKSMLDKLSGHFQYHVGRSKLTENYVLWHSEPTHTRHTVWLSTELLKDMLQAIEQLYHYKIDGKPFTFRPGGYWLDSGYKALAGIQ